MALPAAVQKQVDEANALHDQIYDNEGKAKPPAEPEAPPAEPEAPPAEPEAPPPEGEQQPPTEPPPATPPPTAPLELAQEAPQPETPAAAESKPEPWEQRYNSLKGRFDADSRTMRTQIEGLTEQVRSLNTALARREPEAPTTGAPATPQVDRLLSSDEVEEYGEELIDVVQRAAQEVMQPTLDKLTKENTELKAQMGHVSSSVVQSERQQLLDGLDGQVTGWREVNTSPEYLQWLQAADPYSGEQRHALLKRAFESNNLARVAAFFKGYLSESAVLTAAGQQQAPPARTPQVRMDTLVAPGAPRQGSTPTQEGSKRQWTQAQIATFYREKTAGKYRGDTAAKKGAALEADIFQAQREGRIIP